MEFICNVQHKDAVGKYMVLFESAKLVGVNCYQHCPNWWPGMVFGALCLLSHTSPCFEEGIKAHQEACCKLETMQKIKQYSLQVFSSLHVMQRNDPALPKIEFHYISLTINFQVNLIFPILLSQSSSSVDSPS